MLLTKLQGQIQILHDIHWSGDWVLVNVAFMDYIFLSYYRRKYNSINLLLLLHK